MQTKIIINFRNNSSNKESKFATKMVCYRRWNNKREKQPKQFYQICNWIIKLSLCNSSNGFILVLGDIKVRAINNTDIAFKHHELFSTCKTESNDVVFD